MRKIERELDKFCRRHPPLPRAFYDRDPVAVAPDLLGKLFVRATPEGITAGRLVEVEAYLGARDPASHAFRGRTPRNASMFGPPGHAYVYAIHSRWCMNVVTEPAGTAGAVLLRALEPLAGLELMHKRRAAAAKVRGFRYEYSASADRRTAAPVRNLARGPARLCEAMAIDHRLDGWDLTMADTLWIAEPVPVGAASGSDRGNTIVTTPRVGVTSAHELQLRFCLADSPFVSRPRLR